MISDQFTYDLRPLMRMTYLIFIEVEGIAIEEYLHVYVQRGYG